MFPESARDDAQRMKWIHGASKGKLFMATIKNFRRLLSILVVSESDDFAKMDNIEFRAVIKRF